MRYSSQINTISNKRGSNKIRKFIGKQNDKYISPDFFVINNKKVTDKTEIDELFDIYFVNVGKNVQSKIPKQNETFENGISHNITTNMFKTSTDPVNIIDTTKTLKRKTSSGFDEISTKLLSEIIEDIAYPLTYIINLLFSKGIVPENMKIAKVIPIYKSGEISKLNNYRPIEYYRL